MEQVVTCRLGTSDLVSTFDLSTPPVCVLLSKCVVLVHICVKMSVKIKVKSLNIGEKFDIIKFLIEGSQNKKDIAVRFNLPGSTLSTILKNYVEIEMRITGGSNSKSMRKRVAEFPDIGECPIKWFKQSREKNKKH